MRRFSISDASIYRRSNSPYYYAQLKNPGTGKYLPAKSTRESDERAALLVVDKWIKNGLPKFTGRSNPLTKTFDLDTLLFGIRTAELDIDDARKIIGALEQRGLIVSATVIEDAPDTQLLLPYLETFWNYDLSPYVLEKMKYGHRIGRRHCYEQTSRLSHWRDFFQAETRLRDITRDDLRNLQFHLSDLGRAGKTINSILSAGIVALDYAVENHYLQNNPAAGLKKFPVKGKKRNILSPDLASRIFSIEWPDTRARVANLVAMTTGLRSGEIRALQVQDIGEDRLYINHAWSRKDGLKGTKTDEPRTVPLLSRVRNELLNLVDRSPFDRRGYIFYHIRPDVPCGGEVFLDGLYRALAAVSLEDNERSDPKKIKQKIAELEASSIDFHSWRHFYTKHMADKIKIRKVRIATGHSSTLMAEHYANHKEEKDFLKVAVAVGDIFEDLLPS